MKNHLLEIVSAFRTFPEKICFSSTGTSFKTQSKLTHFIKSMFQKHEIVGSHIWQYIISLDLWTPQVQGYYILPVWSSVILDIGLKCTIVYLRKYIFKFCILKY